MAEPLYVPWRKLRGRSSFSSQVEAERTDAVDRAGITVLRNIQSPQPARQLIRAFAFKDITP